MATPPPPPPPLSEMATGQDESYATFTKLVSTQNSGELPDLTSFHKFILSQPDGAANLSTLSSLTYPTVASALDFEQPVSLAATTTASGGGGAGFRNETSASGSVINLWIYQRVHVDVAALGKSIDINMGGITPGFPGGALYGTLYYDNKSDLSGSCSVAYVGAGLYFSLYFRNNGNTFATFQSVNVGWSSGAAGGSGSWN